MNYSNLLKLAHGYYILASKNLTLSHILKELSSLKTYSDRIEYAEKKLKHLSSGSSRAVYLTPHNTVIKLAKNDKGIDQNKAESKIKVKSKYINKVLNYDLNFIWIEVNLLKKIKPTEFEEMTGINFKDFGKSIEYALKELDNTKLKKPKNYDDIYKISFFKDIVKICKKYKLLPGDIERISSWGIKDKTPVLIDAGFTMKIYKKHYELN